MVKLDNSGKNFMELKTEVVRFIERCQDYGQLEEILKIVKGYQESPCVECDHINLEHSHTFHDGSISNYEIPKGVYDVYDEHESTHRK